MIDDIPAAESATVEYTALRAEIARALADQPRLHNLYAHEPAAYLGEDRGTVEWRQELPDYVTEVDAVMAVVQPVLAAKDAEVERRDREWSGEADLLARQLAALTNTAVLRDAELAALRVELTAKDERIAVLQRSWDRARDANTAWLDGGGLVIPEDAVDWRERTAQSATVDEKARAERWRHEAHAMAANWHNTRAEVSWLREQQVGMLRLPADWRRLVCDTTVGHDGMAQAVIALVDVWRLASQPEETEGTNPTPPYESCVLDDLADAEGRVVEALAELVRELSAPAAVRDYLTAALDELVAYARRRADGHRMGAESYASIQAEIADEQTQWVRAFTAVASLVRGLNPGELLHEWKCPACGATTRARMADYPGGGR